MAATAKRTTKKEAAKAPATAKAPKAKRTANSPERTVQAETRSKAKTPSASSGESKRNTSESDSDTGRPLSERWQNAVDAGDCLPPRTRDENGLSNKDALYRAFVDQLVATGEPMTTEQMRAVIPSYSSSKYSSWRNAWQAYYAGDEELAPRVPKASREYKPTKAAAKRRTKASK